MKVLAFAASLRTGSWNRKLIAAAVEVVTRSGVEVDLADFREFEMPIYDADLQVGKGIPAGAQEMGRRIAAAHGLMISSPEYNFSLPGTLKNAIDWVSRLKPMPLRGKTGLLLSASNGQVGGIRGLWQLRIPLEGLGVTLLPDMYTLPWADQQFDESGRLKDPERQARLERTVGAYLEMARKLAG